MPYYPRIPPACFQANFAPSSLLQDWGASGVGDYTDPYTGLYLDDLYAAESVYGQGYVDANLTAQAQAGLTASELPTPSLTAVPNPGARMKNAEYPTSAMLIGELQSTQDMARAILDVMQGQNRRPAPWVEYKLQLAQRRLRDAVLYVAYGHSSKQANPAKAPGYMARQALTQIAEDASFLGDVIEPTTELPEWTAAYIHDAQIEVQAVYVYAVRASKKENPLNDRQKQALEGVRKRAGTDKAKAPTQANPKAPRRVRKIVQKSSDQAKNQAPATQPEASQRSTLVRAPVRRDHGGKVKGMRKAPGTSAVPTINAVVASNVAAAFNKTGFPPPPCAGWAFPATGFGYAVLNPSKKNVLFHFPCLPHQKQPDNIEKLEFFKGNDGKLMATVTLYDGRRFNCEAGWHFEESQGGYWIRKLQAQGNPGRALQANPRLPRRAPRSPRVAPPEVGGPKTAIKTDPGGPLAPPAHFVQWIRELGYPSSVRNNKIYVSRQTVRQFQQDWNAVVNSALPDSSFYGFRRPVAVNGLTASQEMYEALSRAKSINGSAAGGWQQQVKKTRTPMALSNPAVHGRGPVGRGGWAMTMGRGMAREQNPICNKPWHTGKLECDTDKYTYGDPNCRCEVKQTFKQVPFGPDTWGAKIAPRGPQRRSPGAAPARLLDTRRSNPPQNRMPSPQGPKGWISGCCLDASGTVRCKDASRSFHGMNPEVINEWPNGYTVEIAPGLQKRILACPTHPARQMKARRVPRRAMRGNPAGAGGLVGVCPTGTSYAGTMPRPSNAWAAVCTEDRTGEVVTTFGTARTYPYQHLGYFGYHGY